MSGWVVQEPLTHSSQMKLCSAVVKQKESRASSPSQGLTEGSTAAQPHSPSRARVLKRNRTRFGASGHPHGDRCRQKRDHAAGLPPILPPEQIVVPLVPSSTVVASWKDPGGLQSFCGLQIKTQRSNQPPPNTHSGVICLVIGSLVYKKHDRDVLVSSRNRADKLQISVSEAHLVDARAITTSRC